MCGPERYAAHARPPSSCTASVPRTRSERGIMLADTKFELGVDEEGRVVLADEALTPDSSRFWPADAYAPGGPQPSFDKQYARDWCEGTGWDKAPPGPELPDEVVEGTRARYARPSSGSPASRSTGTSTILRSCYP